PDSSGTPIVSLGPLRVLQFKVDMLPGEDSGSELRVLEFRASEPLAARLVGEVYPTQAPVAEPTSFTYYLRPSISGDNSGFDGLEMTTTSIVNAVSQVRIGEREWPFSITPLDVDGSELPGFPAHRFELTLVDTKLVSRASSTPVEIDFEARVLRSGSVFDLRVFDSGRPLEVRQSVAEGDANNLIEGDRVSVTTTADASSLLQAVVSPAVFTPNGDRVNDAVRISYDLLEIIGLASVTIDITDLSGRVVRRLYEGDDAIGNYRREWDGRDGSGEMVPPGIYLYSIVADTDRGRVARLGSLNIAR
ncbi:MAG: gliding motility-associated C-terminal domain-containing protein, partial [Gemmatimonadetes bacterium]|nr:gliding motility-associated C-terminal domain-containing protein [Gemmatimonadota bacterium]